MCWTVIVSNDSNNDALKYFCQVSSLYVLSLPFPFCIPLFVFFSPPSAEVVVVDFSARRVTRSQRQEEVLAPKKYPLRQNQPESEQHGEVTERGRRRNF